MVKTKQIPESVPGNIEYNLPVINAHTFDIVIQANVSNQDVNYSSLLRLKRHSKD